MLAIADNKYRMESSEQTTMQTPYDTNEVFSLFQLGSKPFPKIRKKQLRKEREITLDEREKLVALRSQQVAAGIEIEACGPHWTTLV